MSFCQQGLRLLQLWRLSAECNATNVALAAIGYVQRAKHALLAENARSTEVSTDFRLLGTAVLPHNNQPPPEKAQNYKIDSTDDNWKRAQKNAVENSTFEKRRLRLTESQCERIGLTAC